MYDFLFDDCTFDMIIKIQGDGCINVEVNLENNISPFEIRIYISCLIKINVSANQITAVKIKMLRLSQSDGSGKQKILGTTATVKMKENFKLQHRPKPCATRIFLTVEKS